MSVSQAGTDQLAAAPEVFEASFFAAPRPLLLVAADPPRFTMLAVNRAHAQAFRTTQEALTGFGVFEVFGAAASPEALAFMSSIRESFEAVLSARRAHQMPVLPYALPGADGPEERFWSAINAPVLDREGEVAQIVSAVSDVTGEVLERRSEEARRLLMREVDHRARNALTVVQSFVRFTSAETVDAFRDILIERVAALARAQTSLAARRWEGAALAEVVEAELRAIVEPERYRIAGPPVELPAEHVQAMGMAMHELATNARKHGALSTSEGAVSVSWRLAGDELSLVWCETGAGKVGAPSRQGFGSRLIAQLAMQLGGEVTCDWRPEGLTATFRLRPTTRTPPA